MVSAVILSTLLLGLASAAPAPALHGPVTLSLTGKRVVSKPDANASRYRVGAATAGLTEWGRDLRYTTRVAIGTPAREVELQIDTGSSLLWTMDLATSRKQFDEGTAVPEYFFNHSQSSSFKFELGNDGKPINGSIGYMKGSTTGYLSRDVVSIAGQTLQDQGFLAAYDWSDDMDPKGVNITGILGLGNSFGPNEPEPAWVRLAAGWKDKVFGVFLSRVATDPGQIAQIQQEGNTDPYPGGELTLGGIDESRIDGKLNYVPRLTSNKNLSPHWTLELDGITAGGKPVTAVAPKTPAVLDTGATIIVAPVNDTRAFYANIPGAVINTAYSRMIGMDLYNVPCNTTFNTAFKIGGIDYPLDNSDLFFVHSGDKGGGSGCFGAVTGGGIDFWLLGDTFLKNVYSAFRVDPPQIGLGKLKHK